MFGETRYNYTFNQRFFIKYDSHEVKIYEIGSGKKENIYLEFRNKIEITTIDFNPSISNIALISYADGTCRIFNLLNQNSKDLILFEGMNDSKIFSSKFSYWNPNVIASININSTIIVWDVRELSYLQVIKSKENIDKFRWSYFSDNYLEIVNEKEEINLINIETKNKIEAKYEIKEDMEIIDFLFINKTNLAIFEPNLILKIDTEKKLIIESMKINGYYEVNRNLIQYNYLILIANLNQIYVFDLSSFSIIISYMLESNYRHHFFYPEENKIRFYSFFQVPRLNKIKNFSIDINKKFEKINNIDNMTNIKNYFYDKYEKYISKYRCILLNFKVKEEEFIYIQNYMSIDEIKNYFDIVKKINLFRRKDAVTDIMNNISKNDLIEELNIKNFNEICGLTHILKNKEIKKNKYEILKKLKEIEDSKTRIKKLYLELIKLLILDNTNQILVDTYLLFLKKFEDKLIYYFQEEKIEKYEDEVKYYSPCFSKEVYKELFEKNKESEKFILLQFIDKACLFSSFSLKDKKFLDFIEKIKIDFPNFNQPLGFDFENNELKWHLLKKHIFSTFKKINTKEIKKEEQVFLDSVKRGLKIVKNKNLLTNNEILNDKNKLASTIYLITNPCNVEKRNPEFFANLLLAKKIAKRNWRKNSKPT